MAYAVKYVFTFQSVGGTTREIRILKDGYSGDPIRRALGRAPILKKQQNGPVHGTSLELYAECHVDQEFIEFYTSDPKAYRVDLYAGSTLLWQGWITPELYSEPDIAPPYDVQVVATDGVGELKLYDFAAQGMVSLRAMLTYLLWKTGLSTDVFLVSSLKAGSAGAGALLDMEANFDYLVGKTCYEALSYLLTTLHATITWWGGHWLLVRENNVTFTSGKVRYFNVAGNSALLANSVQALGRMYQDAAWPVGQLSTVIDPAKNKVVVQAPWHPVTALQNSDMTADANWNKSGVTYDFTKGAYFFARDVITPGELAQSVAFGGLRVPMRMTLSGCGTSETGSGFTGTGNGWVGLVLKFQDGDGNVYYLGVDGDGNRRWDLYDSGRIPRAFEQDLLSVDTDRENADRIELDIPALAVDGGFPSGTLTVGIWGGAVYVFSAHLDVVLNKGYQDILHIDNGARGEGDDTEIAFGRVTSDVAYYQAFVQGILLNNGALITAFSDANFTTGTDYLSFISRDYARSVALPRARVEGTVSLEPSVQLPPLVFTKGGLDYWLETWSWNLYEDELQISARTLPTATLTVDSETITEAGGTASTGSSSGGASSTPVPQVAPNYFEKDGTFVTGIKLKDEFDAVRVPGLRFGNGAQDPDLYVDTIEDSQGNPQRVLRSPLPLITAGDQIVEDGEPGDPEGERLRDLEDVYHDDNSVKRYNGGAVGTSDILAYDSVLGWYAAQLGLNLSMVNGVLTVEGGGGGGTTYNSGTVEELNNGSGTVDRVWTPKVLADWLKGLGYIFAGIATPTDPAETPTPGGKVYYLASTPGTYTNFGGIVVNPGEIAIIKGSGSSWTKDVVATLTDVINSDKYASVLVDPAGKLIATIGLDGVVTFYGKVDFKKGDWEEIASENYAEILTDPNGKMIEALTLDGKRVFFGPVEFRGGVVNGGAGEFANRSIAWYGTSIPAGSAAYTLPITGGEIDAYITNYRQAVTHFAAGAQLPAEYPVIVAALLGAKAIFNEAQGSSRICRNTSSASLLIRCKALTNSVQEICLYIWGAYNIDIEHETFAENHNNTIGITTFLTTAGTWSSFVNNVCICLRQSYEICLTLRHLLPTGAQRSAFITRVFGSYLSDVSDMLASVGYTMDDLCGYHEADLFALEHSVNDGISTFSGDVDSTDLSKVEGAYNLIIGTILQYKPSARIAILSNYARTYNAQQADKAAYLKAIAEHWGVPFFDPAPESQVSWNEQLTCGYWDVNQVWHDSGFTWVPNSGADTYTSNCKFPTAYSDPSLTAMEQLIHPQQIDGVWYWKIPNGYTWLWDGLHPHSAHDGRLTMLLARLIAGWLPTLNFIK